MAEDFSQGANDGSFNNLREVSNNDKNQIKLPKFLDVIDC